MGFYVTLLCHAVRRSIPYLRDALMQLPLRLATTLIIALAAATSSYATVHSYSTYLSEEGSGSLGTGFAHIDYDDTAHTLNLNANWTGLSSPTTNAHIHAPTAMPFTGNASVATTVPSFDGFPTGVTAGTFSTLLDLTMASSWNPAFITNNGGTTAGAEAAFAMHLADGKSYLNIHTQQFGSGEIRGYFAVVPEPATLALISVGVLAPFHRHRRRPRE